MKTVKIIIIALLAVVLGSNSYAQMHDHSKMDLSKTGTDTKMDMSSTKTETIKVWGECETCKANIERAAKIDGVRIATIFKRKLPLSAMIQKSIKLTIRCTQNSTLAASTKGRNNLSILIFQCNSHGSTNFR